MSCRSQNTFSERTYLLKITEHNRKWWVLFAMTASISMIFVDVTVLPVTLPTIERELEASQLALQWLINAYLLTLTVLLLAGGRLGDIFGLRKVFCLGLVLFSCASALCGLSPTTNWFVAARALQGIGGALLIPTTTAILYSAFPFRERGKAIGIYVSIGSVFLAIGPLFGGSVAEYLSWRYVFWINIPIALFGLTLTLLIVPRSERKKESFDFAGFFTLGAGISSLVVGIMQAPSWGWTSPLTITLLLLGGLLIALLVILDRKVEHPLIDFTIFRNKLFVGGNLCIFCTQFFLMSTVFWAIYFQTILGYTPTEAGAISLLPNAPVLFAAPLAGYLTDRFGPKPPVIVGFLLVIFSLFFFNYTLDTQTLATLIWTLLPFGTGIALIFTPSSVASLSQVPDHKRGVTSGINQTSRQFGSTLGMAIIGSVFLHTQINHFEDFLQKNPQTAELHVSQFDGLLAKSKESVQAMNSLAPAVADYVQSSYMEAYKVAFSQINLIAACAAIVGLMAAIFLLRKHFTS